MTIENIYAIASGPEDNPVFCYVGKTISKLDTYWKYTHCKNYNTESSKSVYEHIRQNGGIDEYRIVLLDTTENGQVERDYVIALTEAGHKLFNDNLGNSKVSAKASKVKSAFTVMNKDAEARLALAERAASRRNILMNSAQQLSKSEIVRQRITKEPPSFEELSQYAWKECPGELISVRIGKTAERAEYVKVGDYSVFIAERPATKKIQEYTAVMRHRDGTEVCGPCGESWVRWDRDLVLQRLCDRASDRTQDYWYKLRDPV